MEVRVGQCGKEKEGWMEAGMRGRWRQGGGADAGREEGGQDAR